MEGSTGACERRWVRAPAGFDFIQVHTDVKTIRATCAAWAISRRCLRPVFRIRFETHRKKPLEEATRDIYPKSNIRLRIYVYTEYTDIYKKIHASILDRPIMNGLSASGITIDPSSCWLFSRMATIILGTAHPVPLRVWTNWVGAFFFFLFLPPSDAGSLGLYLILSRLLW